LFNVENRNDLEQLQSEKKLEDKQPFSNGAINNSANGGGIENDPTAAARTDTIEPM
jgi:hypothetical protein